MDLSVAQEEPVRKGGDESPPHRKFYVITNKEQVTLDQLKKYVDGQEDKRNADSV